MGVRVQRNNRYKGGKTKEDLAKPKRPVGRPPKDRSEQAILLKSAIKNKV